MDRKKRNLSIVGLIIVLMVMMVIPLAGNVGVVRAAAADFDFSTGELGWVGINRGSPYQTTDTFHNGTAWEGTPLNYFGNRYGTSIRYDLPTPTQLTYVTVCFDGQGTGTNGVFVQLYDASFTYINTYVLPNNGCVPTHMPSEPTIGRIEVFVDNQHLSTLPDLIERVVLEGGFPTPTPGPTPTGTITPTFTPTPYNLPSGGGGILGKVCKLMHLATSTFTPLPGEWLQHPDPTDGLVPANPPGLGSGLRLFAGSVSTDLYLDESQLYKIDVGYHLPTTTGADEFYIGLGSTLDFAIPITNVTAEQIYTVTEQNFLPDVGAVHGYYTLTVGKNSHANPVIVDYICVYAFGGPGGTESVDSGAVPIVEVVCRNCEYQPTGNILEDLGRLLRWLWCNFQNLWTCVIYAILNGVWKAVADTITMLAFLRLWASRGLENAGAWINGNLRVLWDWWSGTLRNLLTFFYNLLLNVPLFVLGVQVWNAIAGFLNGVFQVLADAIQASGMIISVIFTWIGNALRMVLNLLGLVPQIFSSLSTGVNETSTLPSWATSGCTAGDTFYAICQGMYVLDNTLLDGVGVLYIPLVGGYAATGAFLWTLRQVKEALQRS